MRPTFRHLLWTSAAALTALGVPAAVEAQQSLDLVRVTANRTRADHLDARAAKFERSGNIRDFGRAARLREQAADLRAPEDPAAFTSLQRAAVQRHAIGQKQAAAGLMERAADQAMARGDVYNASRAYIDVAYIAAELRDGPRVRTFVEKGTLLMHSPLLDAGQRELLRSTVAQAPQAVRDVATAPPR